MKSNHVLRYPKGWRSKSTRLAHQEDTAMSRLAEEGFRPQIRNIFEPRLGMVDPNAITIS